MKSKTQKAGRTPQGSRSHKMTVDLPADCWIFKLPPEQQNEAANHALKVFLAKRWESSPRMQPFELMSGVMVVPVPLTKQLANEFTTFANARGLHLGAVVGSQAKTWRDSVANNGDALDEPEAVIAALRYQQEVSSELVAKQEQNGGAH